MTDRPQSTPGRQVRKRAYDGKWARWELLPASRLGIVEEDAPKLSDGTPQDFSMYVCTGVFTSRYKALFA